MSGTMRINYLHFLPSWFIKSAGQELTEIANSDAVRHGSFPVSRSACHVRFAQSNAKTCTKTALTLIAS